MEKNRGSAAEIPNLKLQNPKKLQGPRRKGRGNGRARPLQEGIPNCGPQVALVWNLEFGFWSFRGPGHGARLPPLMGIRLWNWMGLPAACSLLFFAACDQHEAGE